MAQSKPPSREEVERNLRQNRGPDERHGPGAPIEVDRVDMRDARIRVEEKGIDDRGLPSPTPGARGIVNPRQVQ